MNLYKLLAKTPNYVRRFGAIDGLRLLYEIEGVKHLPSKSELVKKYSVPGFDAPIYLRECLGDHAIFWQCLVMNQYDFSKFPQAQRLNEKYAETIASNQTPLIIDCGGNIGLSALWFASQYPKAQIFVVEPDHGNFEILKLNVAHLGDRVKLLKGGVWSTAGYLKIINHESGTSAYRVQLTRQSDSPDALRCYTINEICTLANNSNPLIVKIDIEGSQKDLFSGGTDWVDRTDLISLELDDWLLPWQGTSRSFFKCLGQYPFDYLLNGESIFCFKDHAASAASLQP